jgi:hypothetical protein
MRARNSPLFQLMLEKDIWPGGEPETIAFGTALKLHRKAVLIGRLRRFWANLTGSSYRLVDLDTLKADEPIYGWRYDGVQVVHIDQIVGSEMRCDEFDKCFYPLCSHDSSRWLSAAIVSQLGLPAPPIEVIRLGSKFYAQSGFYQISVARVNGQRRIKAYVTHLDVARSINGKEGVKNG